MDRAAFTRNTLRDFVSHFALRDAHQGHLEVMARPECGPVVVICTRGTGNVVGVRVGAVVGLTTAAETGMVVHGIFLHFFVGCPILCSPARPCACRPSSRAAHGRQIPGRKSKSSCLRHPRTAKNPASFQKRGFCFGGDKRDRTADLLNAIQALSQLSYTPMFLAV